MIEVYYTTDVAKLEQYKNDLLPVTDIDEESIDEALTDNALSSEVIVDSSLKLHTGLDDSIYYNADRDPASLSIAYIASSEFLDSYAAFVGEQIEQAGIKVTYQPLEADSLSDILSQEDSDYDILLTGIHLGIFDYNIFPFFHSGQAKIGQNFARLRNLELDGLLEQLRDRVFYSAPDQLVKIQKDIVSILDTQFVVFPISTPTETLAYDKELSGVNIPDSFPSTAHLPQLVSKMSIHQGFEADVSNKSLF